MSWRGSCVSLLAWVVLTWGCGDSSSPSNSGETDGGGGASARDSLFADRGLEAAVRATLSRPEGKVTQEELSSLKDLDASSLGIKSLEGLGRLDSLQSLNLSDNEVSDLTPLASLVRLEYLDLSNNHLTEVSALASLVQLKVLILERNALQDLSPLQGLSHLERLELTKGMVEPSAVAGLEARGVEVVWAVAGELPSSGGAGSPTGAGPRIAFSAYGLGAVGNADIWVMAPDGSNPKKLISSADNETEPAWSPDGTQLAYVRGVVGRDIYVLRLGEKEPIRLTHEPGDEYAPAWSPDGSRIAYVHANDVYVMAADGSGSENLTQHPAKNFDPSWSPDGERIVFASDRDSDSYWEQSDVFAMDAEDGGNVVNLTRHPSRNFAPCFSPDGTRIAFSSDRERSGSYFYFDIYSMKPDGSDLRNLTSTSWPGGLYADSHRVAWSTGDRLLFEHDGLIWAMSLDGRYTAKLTAALWRTAAIRCASPAWVADAAPDLVGVEAQTRFFVDAVLERAVLAQIRGIPEEEITEEDLLTVTSITCQDCGIRDLEGIEKLRSLRSLSLTNEGKDPAAVPDDTWNQVRGFSALVGLPELASVRLAVSPEADLSELAQLTQLTELSLAGDGIVDLTPLASLTALKTLSLTSNRLEELGPLSELQALTGLYLTCSRLSDLSPLSGLRKLRLLMVEKGQVCDLTPLSSLPSLVGLYLDGNQVEDLAPLASVTTLVELSLASNLVKDVSALLSLPRLRQVNLSMNPLGKKALRTDIPVLVERGVMVTGYGG